MTIREELSYWKVSELKKFASDIRIKGRSKMTTDELIDAIVKCLEQQ